MPRARCATAKSLHDEGRQRIGFDLREVDRLVELFVDEAHDGNVLAAHNVEAECHRLRAVLRVDALHRLFEHAVDVLIEATQFALGMLLSRVRVYILVVVGCICAAECAAVFLINFSDIIF